MSEHPLIKKLLIKPNQKVLVINPPQGYLEELRQLPEGVSLATSPDGTCDVIQLFVKSTEELKQLAPAALSSFRSDSVFWVSYPKQTSKVKTDLSRDSGWDVLIEAGLRVVSLFAIDDTWAALRFRPIDQVVDKKKS